MCYVVYQSCTKEYHYQERGDPETQTAFLIFGHDVIPEIYNSDLDNAKNMQVVLRTDEDVPICCFLEEVEPDVTNEVLLWHFKSEDKETIVVVITKIPSLH